MITPFDIQKPYVFVDIVVTHFSGNQHAAKAIIDTGAPRTEFADAFLGYAGFLTPPKNVNIRDGLQTRKYHKLTLPSMVVCNRTMNDLEIIVSRFDPSWGIAALIGLDFFRRFRVTIDYQIGQIRTEPYR